MSKSEKFGDYGDSRSGVVRGPKIPVTGNMDKTSVTNTAGNPSQSEAHFRKTVDKAVNGKSGK
jgi:hypothetical protein